MNCEQASMQEDKAARVLIGGRLASIEHRDHSWFFKFADQIALATESPWRLIVKDRIEVTSEDHGHPFGLPQPVDAVERVQTGIDGSRVAAVEIISKTGDLVLHFENGAQLQFLQISSGYESWRLSTDAHLTVCTGGGRIKCLSAR